MLGISKKLITAILILGFVLGLYRPASADSPLPEYSYATPIFGVAAAPDNSLLVADAGAGVIALRNGEAKLVASLPGVADIAPIGRGVMFAITGGGDSPTAGKLFRVSMGKTRKIADLAAFEARVNPDGGEIDSNPFDVASLGGGKALVADAGGNSILIVTTKGKVDWVATLPPQLVATATAKQLVDCPTPPAGLEDICALPDMIPAQAVATSVAIGPDGAYYVGELKGFPGAVGTSRVWRIEPGTRHADCAVSSACSVVLDGFTSIVDLAFGPDGTLYVVEIDEASFLAVELANYGVFGKMVGGTVNACDSSTWTCSVKAGGLTIPIGVTVTKTGTVYAAVSALMPDAHVVELP